MDLIYKILGLYGSRAYARKYQLSFLKPIPKLLSIGELRDLDANVTLMVQADMLAYRKPGEPMQLGLPDKYEGHFSFLDSFLTLCLCSESGLPR